MNEKAPILHNVAIALGSNLGDRLAALRAAVEGLAPYVKITGTSHIYETSPVYVENQPVFLNAAVIGETVLSPLPLLRAVKNLENEIGRLPTFHYGPRVIDIDLVYYDDEIINLPELSLPHPRMSEREFVLRPLNDIVPAWRNPVTGHTVGEMLADVAGQSPRFSESL